jgi:hypothetical protein
LHWTKGPVGEIGLGFEVGRFAPHGERRTWTYATIAMSNAADAEPLELHLLAPRATDEVVELLTVVAHYHRTGARLGLGHTVNFGRPWIAGSRCDHGLVSLPYLDGPTLEWCALSPPAKRIRCLWLIPITAAEVAFKKANGLEALEEAFDRASLDYANVSRASVV